jgi:hypothetical protein
VAKGVLSVNPKIEMTLVLPPKTAVRQKIEFYLEIHSLQGNFGRSPTLVGIFFGII